MKMKLQEGYVFGTMFTFEVEVSKVDAPTNPCTNHRFLNKDNVEQVYNLLCGDSIARVQVSPMILCPKTYIGEDGVQVDFLDDGGKDRFQKLRDAYVRENGDEDQARGVFLRCFTWEPVDGQHIRVACQELASEDLKNGLMRADEYEYLFTRWPAQVVISMSRNSLWSSLVK
jgi:putative transposon-encoded protein